MVQWCSTYFFRGHAFGLGQLKLPTTYNANSRRRPSSGLCQFLKIHIHMKTKQTKNQNLYSNFKKVQLDLETTANHYKLSHLNYVIVSKSQQEQLSCKTVKQQKSIKRHTVFSILLVLRQVFKIISFWSQIYVWQCKFISFESWPCCLL